eukprot:CAMPEP_0174378998 /NCGR_PEP_ID=MMETSP0811_2-20130205/122418_1 /TAXON_ID=73025 ORGANISM="Eutreptiella gymnastica-like, Strain CCMP1594" /NCGR_SAMPLE_ID=MMETSP0811_2 /ASSEMBLY_ACC=CAM_ASM_000667 /LENGTH=75 /DNA_ID=CAMNT_0015531387 /DNA_START=556 /DNA_END=781 /DNA_ORIENTATION=+
MGGEGDVQLVTGHPPTAPDVTLGTAAHRKGEGASAALCRGPLEGKGPQRRSQQQLHRWLEEVANAVGGGYCRLQM